MDSRLKTRLRVQAIIRQCETRAVPAMVVRKGDPDAGALLVKVNAFDSGCTVLTPVTDAGGRRGWMRGTGPQPVDEPTADAYIARQARYDEDLWVVEIESRDGWHPLEDDILAV
ncbi:hypothetical protein C882_3654 [Caenispirillum salinarum AK4]|uniref:ATP-dependent Zn protease n=1 Tax=Caenispirillum salinarum AK4 TaxID=1238182 RepID=K9HSG8_9PROT|nr:DUF1491 family protein [Caenispirillum salinarum]EKV31281.1 hypothetical protein C882_3654 [Caenispirillum salinarum AK4]